MHKILVCGAGGPAANNFIDSLQLSDNEYEIYGVDSNKYMLELSKADKTFEIPPCTHKNYIEEINDIIEYFGIHLIHPQPDVEVAEIASRRKLLAAPTFLPANYTIALCQNKQQSQRYLEKAKIAVPETWDIVDNDLTEHFNFFGTLWMRASQGANSKAALPVTDQKQIDGWLDYWFDREGMLPTDFMVSEFLPGREFAWQSLWFEGQLVIAQARERLQYFNASYSPTGQTSSPSVARTVNDERITQLGIEAVEAVALKPHGVFSVDMKENIEDLPCVTEINPGRFFTTSNFFSRAGLNIPEIYIELALTGTFEDRPGRLDPLKEDLFWVRQMDMGSVLVDGQKWSK